MLSEEVRVRLRGMGIFPTDEGTGKHAVLGNNPFFAFRDSSVEPTDEELDRLLVIAEAHRSSRFVPAAIDRFWGRGANTIKLWNTARGWRYRCMTFKDPYEWCPERAFFTLEELSSELLRGKAA